MRIFLFSLVTAFSIFSQAQANGCLDKISSLQNWPSFSEAQQSCLSSNSDFNTGLAYLCSPGNENLSDKYKSYLSYQQQYAAAAAEFRQATDTVTRTVAANKMQDAADDWLIRGFRNDVEINLNLISGVEFSCTQ